VKKPERVVEKQTPTPTPAPAEHLTDFPRVIACNPRRFEPEYFKREKPCVSDMTTMDIERENKALAVINKAIAANSSLPYTYGSFSFFQHPQYIERALHTYGSFRQLFVSDKRYQVVQVTIGPFLGFVVVDTIGEKVTDYFVPFSFVEKSTKRFVFLDKLTSQQGETIGDFVRQYTFGKEKSITLTATEVYYPQTYYYFTGPEGSTGVKVLSSTTNSVTLGIYDSNKPLPQKPGDDFVEFEQVGTKVINLAD